MKTIVMVQFCRLTILHFLDPASFLASRVLRLEFLLIQDDIGVLRKENENVGKVLVYFFVFFFLCTTVLRVTGERVVVDKKRQTAYMFFYVQFYHTQELKTQKSEHLVS